MVKCDTIATPRPAATARLIASVLPKTIRTRCSFLTPFRQGAFDHFTGPAARLAYDQLARYSRRSPELIFYEEVTGTHRSRT